MFILAESLTGCVTVQPAGIPTAKPDLPKAARINTELGVRYAREGYYPLAKTKLKRAVSQQNDYAPAHAALAYVYSRTGDGDLAEKEYRRALELKPNDPDIQNNFGVFLCARGKDGEAQAYFRRALANPDYATPAAAWTNAGICARNLKQDQHAESDFRKALTLDPHFLSALEQMAMLKVHERDYKTARFYERRYRQLSNQPGPAMLMLSARTERALGNAEQASAFERQLVQQYPDSAQAAQLSSKNP